MFRRVGVVCVDEGHHVVARTFWGVMSQCPALTRVVLTATPRRKDGLMDQLQWIAGPVIFRAIRKVDDVRVVCVEYVNDEHVELLGYGGMLNSAEMVNRLCADGARTAIAVDIAACLAITQGRRVVVVTPRVAHVTEVAALLEARLVAAGVAQRNVALRVDEPFPGKKPRRKKSMTRAERKTYRHALRAFERAKNAWEDDGTHWHMETFTCPLVGVVKRGMKALPRQIQFEGVAVVATSDIMEEGVSYKAWDTLVDLDNSSDAEQVVGRILRECPGKKVPLVVDVWINMSYFGHLFWKRHKHYVEQRFNIVRMQAKSVADVAVSHVWDCYNAPATYVNGV
jgi:superfamily II DNA or RNA helicase